MTATLPISPVKALDDRFLGLEGGDLVAAMIDAFGDQFAVVSSFGTESAVLLHLTAQVSKDVPIIFLNTGKLFGETLKYQRTLVARLGLNRVHTVEPDADDVAQFDPKGVLWATHGNQCCFIRKAQPFAKALKGYTAWATGRKSYQGGARGSLSLVETDGPRIKVNPLANWTEQQVQTYLEDHRLPRHPLVKDGYTSVGCMSCTAPTLRHENARDGRWRDQDKSECGIHTPDLFLQARTGL